MGLLEDVRVGKAANNGTMGASLYKRALQGVRTVLAVRSGGELFIVMDYG